MENPSRLSRIFFFCLLTSLALSGAVNCGSGNGGPPGPSGIPLSVSVTGIGSGSVASNVGNIDCTKAGGTCNASIAAETAVTLTAAPDKGFFFNGWLGGACQGIGTCTLTLSQAASVQAAFVNVAFISNRDLNPAQDAASNPSTENIWLANSDGGNPQAISGIVALNADSALPSFSPDGNQIVFLSSRNLDGTPTGNPNNTRNVWVVDADGSNPHPLAGLDVVGTSAQFNNPRWSPDGNQIVFVSRRNINGTPTAATNSTDNIWVVNADGTAPTALAGLDVASVSSEMPVWSPDGTKIVFTSNRNIDLSPTANPNNEKNIWVMNANGNGLLPLTKITVGGAFADWPQWSPDGSEIAFQSSRSLGSDPNGPPVTATNIWKMNADGSNPVALTQDTGSLFNVNPQWSPDGSLITYRSSQDPVNPNPNGPASSANIWAVSPDGSQNPFPLTALTDNSVGSFGPCWAPDGSVVIFDSNRNLNPSLGTPANPSINVWIVNPDGSGAFPVTDLTDPSAFADSAFDLD